MTGTSPKGELIIGRHGQAHCNVEGIIAGPACTGLTEPGRAAAAALAHRLANGPPLAALHASSTPRARETAEIIGGALGIPIQEHPQLRVPDPGSAEGLSWAVARTAGVDTTNPVRPTMPGSEPWTQYLARAMDCLRHISDEVNTGRALVVGHSETLTALFSMLLGTSDLVRLKITLDFAAITTFRAVREYDGVPATRSRWELICHNDGRHLSATRMPPPDATEAFGL
jgi:probable phosphoglycerate mutase